MRDSGDDRTHRRLTTEPDQEMLEVRSIIMLQNRVQRRYPIAESWLEALVVIGGPVVVGGGHHPTVVTIIFIVREIQKLIRVFLLSR